MHLVLLQLPLADLQRNLKNDILVTKTGSLVGNNGASNSFNQCFKVVVQLAFIASIEKFIQDYTKCGFTS